MPMGGGAIHAEKGSIFVSWERSKNFRRLALKILPSLALVGWFGELELYAVYVFAALLDHNGSEALIVLHITQNRRSSFTSINQMLTHNTGIAGKLQL